MISAGLGTIIGSGLGVAGNIVSGIAGANAEEEARKRRLEAYNNMIKKANETQQQGEQAINDVVNNPNAYLKQANQDIIDQNNQALNAGRNQLNASLSQQGVRGGQAATQLARGIGNMTQQANQNLTQLNYNDLAQRNNLKAAYNQAKALAGVNAGLQQFQG